MRGRLVVVAVLISLAGWAIWHQVGSRVIAESIAPSGEGRVIVREIQLQPFSLTALTRANEMVYRCEYYPHRAWPMFAAQSFSEDSYIARTATIEWRDGSNAEVIIDNIIAFACMDGQWRRLPTNSLK